MSPTRRMSQLLRASAILALVALALMLWPIFDPQPIAVVVAMSVGQALGTLSFLAFGVVVAIDLYRARVIDIRGRTSEPPPSPKPKGEEP